MERELNELDSFGKTEAGEYHQASFFDPEYGLAATTKQTSDYAEKAMEKLAKNQSEAKAGKYNYLYPKKEPDVPHEYMHIPQELRIRSRGTERHSASD